MADLLIDNVRLPDGAPGQVLIQDGRIAAVGSGLAAPAEVPRLDGHGWDALPGCIDMHVHFRTPGAEHKETLLTGAAAAAKGGTTTCGDMPNTTPRTTTMAALEQKIALAEGAACDLFFNFGAEPDNLEQVRAAARHPRVKALKIYMGPSTGQGGLAPDAVRRQFRLAAELDLPVMVHAEDIAMIDAEAPRHPHDARHHTDLRPPAAEVEAVRQALALAAEFPVRLCISHTTNAGVIRLAEDSGFRERIFIEVAPHHLVFSTEDIDPPQDNRFRVNPPIRDAAMREALWAELNGGIDGLGSDHAPHTLAEKNAPYDEAPSGIPGVEYMLPLAYHWYREGVISRERLIALSAGRAAEFFGLNKGTLTPGRDGDVVLVDPAARWRIGQGDDTVASKCGWTPYAGRPMRGRPMVTIVGGRPVYQYPHA